MQIFQCTPVNFVWDGWAGDFGEHRCLNVNVLAWVSGGVSIAQDVVILALPLPALSELHASRRVKAGILLMFSLGIFICATSCIRLRYLVVFAKSTNPTWDYTDAMVWTSIEVCISIIVTSLPAIRVFLGRLRPGIFGTGDGTGTGTRGKSFPSRGREADSSPSSPSKNIYGRSPQSRLFSAMARSGSPDSAESQLELGIRGSSGDVRTEITVADCKSQRTRSPSDGEREKRSRSRSRGLYGRRKKSPAAPDPDGQGSGIHVVRTYSTKTTRVVMDRGRPVEPRLL